MRLPSRRHAASRIPAALLLAGALALRLRGGEDRPPLRIARPLELEVRQRATALEGTLLVEGELATAGEAPSTLETRLGGGGIAMDWHNLATLPAEEKTFRAEWRVPAGGWYRLEVRVRREGAVVAEATVEHVGVGEVFLVAGQSNAANHGEERQRTRTGRVATFHGGKWQLALDPQPGATGEGGSLLPPLGDALVERLGVPVGFIPAAVGATSVREWLPRGERFPAPPTLVGNVRQVGAAEWESLGTLFAGLAERLRQAGPHGLRAILWHQGESDANQRDASRTLPGALYREFLSRLISASRREAGWEVPWVVAQASYHDPLDPGSPDIRAAQAALWAAGIALEGPDSDALAGELRDAGGRGVHLSGKGLRVHGECWAEKVAPWLEARLEEARGTTAPGEPEAPPGPAPASSSTPLTLRETERFTVAGQPAFFFLPPPGRRATPQPWVLYAPTRPQYPDEAERWMHEQLVAAGIAVAGIDVGEAHGSPRGRELLDELYRELTGARGFASRPCLLGRSRGGLWVSSWALAHPELVAGIAGIYPVFDLRSYPGLEQAAAAHGLTAPELEARLRELNPVERIMELARARIPVALIHGDKDDVVPLVQNSAELARRYREAGAAALVRLEVVEGQGHNMFQGFFHSRPLVEFMILHARAGAQP